MTGTPLPVLERLELDALKEERERLSRRLQKVRMDAHSRIRIQQKLMVLTALQVKLERTLGIGQQ